MLKSYVMWGEQLVMHYLLGEVGNASFLSERMMHYYILWVGKASNASFLLWTSDALLPWRPAGGDTVNAKLLNNGLINIINNNSHYHFKLSLGDA